MPSGRHARPRLSRRLKHISCRLSHTSPVIFQTFGIDSLCLTLSHEMHYPQNSCQLIRNGVGSPHNINVNRKQHFEITKTHARKHFVNIFTKRTTVFHHVWLKKRFAGRRPAPRPSVLQSYTSLQTLSSGDVRELAPAVEAACRPRSAPIFLKKFFLFGGGARAGCGAPPRETLF